MPNRSEVLAIIPGKGTSSRVPGKNLRLLGGKPLVAWTIEAALGAKSLTRIVVSTENEAVAEIARGLGVEVVSHPPLDELPEVPDVCLHVLHVLEAEGYEPDTVVCLLPSSPFRTAEQIDEAIGPERSSEANTLSMSAPRHHRGIGVAPNGWIEPNAEHNGAILVASTARLKDDGFFSPFWAVCYRMDPISGLDVNTEQDFKYAERVAAKMLAKVPA